ncbi:catechol 2,3-dioxygenase-like lactoylglutathione lyase family enzyme [Bradyrhizobium sp. AZCC 1588]|uniref:glyoxalase superfamily protein n=1 Tax=unclassified Bradyrhizobium TaxID=2631580 RepID=UPI002FF257AA
MPTIDQAKTMAQRLRFALATRNIDMPHLTALELIAAAFGYDDWTTASVKMDAEPPRLLEFLQAIPILRIFDEAKARAFYCDFLGFAVEFEHRFEARLPLYMGVSRAGVRLHLTEHHGDACPGSTVLVPMHGIQAFYRELIDKQHGFGRPGIEQDPEGDVMEVRDPFGNRIRFWQELAHANLERVCAT